MGGRIIIADDDYTLLMYLRKQLEAEGYEVDEASNGGIAFDRLAEANYDLAIIDYEMPLMGGKEFCEKVRESEQFKNLPVILVTAHATRTEQDFLADGATAVMFKPLEIEALVAKITEVTGKKGA